MRVAVIGCGSIGRRHIGNLLALGCARVYGYDPSPEARALAQQAHPQAGVFGMLGGDETFDAWVIATPYDNHLYWVEEAVRRKIPFFCEKPLGSLDQLPRWRAIAALDLPVNQIGYQLRFHNDVSWLRQYATPEWTPLEHIALSVKWDASKYQDWLLESSHEVDLLLHLQPDAKFVAAERTGVQSVSIGFDCGWVSLDGSGRYHRDWRIVHGHRDMRVHYDDPSQLGDAMYLEEMRTFVELCTLPRPLMQTPTLHDGLKVLELCAQVEALTKATA